MTSTTRKSAYIQGVIAGFPFVFVAAPFSMLFGVLASEAGLSLAQVMGFTVVVIAGAAQFTAVQLFNDQAPVWVILAASLAVNLRMAMYSASLQPYLGTLPIWHRAVAAYANFDQSYAVSVAKFDAEPNMPVLARFSYFMGSVTAIVPTWYTFTLVGAVTGNSIPESWALDFVMPVMFLSLVGPMLRTYAHLAAAITSIVVALIFGFLPSGTGLLIAAFAAMAVGAEIERRLGQG